MLLACIVGAARRAAAALRGRTDRQYYSASVEEAGLAPAHRLELGRDPHVDYDDAAGDPTIAVVDSGIDDEHPEFADDGHRPRERGLPQRRIEKGRPQAGRDLESGYGIIVAGLAAAPCNGLGIWAPRPTRRCSGAHRAGDGLGGLACALDYLAGQIYHGPVGLLVVNSRCSTGPPSAACGGASAKSCAAVRCSRRRRATSARTAAPAWGFPGRLPHVLAIGDAERQALLKGSELDLLAPGGSLDAPVIGGRLAAHRPAADVVRDGHRVRRRGGGVGRAPGRVGADGAAGRVAPAGHRLARQDLTPRPGLRDDRRRGSAAFRRRIPADDESEPNDSASDASGGRVLPPLRVPVRPARAAASSAPRTTPRTGGPFASRQPQGLPAGRRAGQLQRRPGPGRVRPRDDEAAPPRATP